MQHLGRFMSIYLLLCIVMRGQLSGLSFVLLVSIKYNVDIFILRDAANTPIWSLCYKLTKSIVQSFAGCLRPLHLWPAPDSPKHMKFGMHLYLVHLQPGHGNPKYYRVTIHKLGTEPYVSRWTLQFLPRSETAAFFSAICNLPRVFSLEFFDFNVLIIIEGTIL